MLDDEIRAGLVAAARAAAAARVLPRFRALAEGDVATKSGPTDLVTRADTEAEADVTAAIRSLWPAAAALGEEAVAADKSLRELMAAAEWAVVTDPVDGTWNFAKGLSVFGMILAVLNRGAPAWGMLYDPLLDDWVEAAAGGGARLVSGRSGAVRDLATSDESRVSQMTGYVPLGLFHRREQGAVAATFPDFLRVTSLRCACHEYRMLAQGHVDFCLSGPLPHPWDHAAGALAVREAGGVVRFLDGEPYNAARLRGVVLAAANPAAWEVLADRYSFLA